MTELSKELSVEQQFIALSNGYRAVFIAENLLREFVRAVLTEGGFDIERECYDAMREGSSRHTSLGAIKNQEGLESCTLSELINILFRPPKRARVGCRFEEKIKNLDYRDLRSMLNVARGIRNAVAHFSPVSPDAVATVRESSRWILEFLAGMGVTSSRVKQLAEMYREQTDDEVFRRRSLACAAFGIPHPSVIADVAEHLLHPDPETAAISELPGAIAATLDLRQTIRFSQNATQAFRDIIDVVRFHELDHDSRPGEEGADLARLLTGNRGNNSSAGSRLVYSDVDHSALQHMARAMWHKDKVTVVKLSDLIFDLAPRGDSSGVTELTIQRYLSELDRRDVSVVVMPHVCWVNGARLDVRMICRELRAKHPLATTVVDGAQAVGHVPLNVEQCERENEDIDFYIGCGHKWLRGPETVGFVRVGRRYNNESECQRCLNFLATSDQLTDASGLALNYQGEQGGTNQRGLAKGLLRALKFIPDKKVDRDKYYARIRLNANRLREVIKTFPRLVLLDPPESLKTGIVTFTVEGSDSGLLTSLQDALRAEQFESMVYALPSYLNARFNRGEFLRFSPGTDLSEQDFSDLQGVFTRILG